MAVMATTGGAANATDEGGGIPSYSPGPDARNRDRAPDSPGMLVVSGSLGCDNAYGEFVVDRIERGAAGKLAAVDVGFVRRSDGADRPVLRWRVRFQA